MTDAVAVERCLGGFSIIVVGGVEGVEQVGKLGSNMTMTLEGDETTKEGHRSGDCGMIKL